MRRRKGASLGRMYTLISCCKGSLMLESRSARSVNSENDLLCSGNYMYMYMYMYMKKCRGDLTKNDYHDEA